MLTFTKVARLHIKHTKENGNSAFFSIFAYIYNNNDFNVIT